MISPKNLSVLRFNPYGIAEVGGLEQRLRILTSGLMKRGIKQHIICASEYVSSRLDLDSDLDPTIHPIDGLFKQDGSLNRYSSVSVLGYTEKLIKLLSGDEIDIVHIHKPVGYFPYNFITSVIPWLMGKVVITTFHGFVGSSSKIEDARSPIVKLMEKFATKLAYRTAVSIATANEVKRYFGNSWSHLPESLMKTDKRKDEILVNYISFDTSHFDPKKYNQGQSRTSLNQNYPDLMLDQNDFLMIYPARILPGKGQRDLVELARNLRGKNIDDFKIIIAGHVIDPSYYEQIQGLIQTYELARYVFVLDPIPTDKMPILYSASDVLVFPTRKEGMGNIAGEALAMERPVVAYRVGGISEIVLDNQTGYLVTPESINEMAQEIIYLKQNPDILETMGKKGREHIKSNFTEEIFLDGWEKIYRELYSEL